MNALLRILAYPFRALRLIWRAIAAILSLLVGRFNWQAPPWLRWIGRGFAKSVVWSRANPGRASAGGLIAVALIAAAGWGAWWYSQRPKPASVAVTVSAPGPMKLDEPEAKPEPLIVRFSESTAPLEKVGKNVDAGVTLTPKHEGVWKWENDKTLRFEPARDWPVGESYRLSFAKRGFSAPQVDLAQYDIAFQSAPFVAKVSEAQFYQDPIDPDLKKAVINVNFSHPVNAAEFERRITLRLAGQSEGVLGIGGESTKFNVSYDKRKLNAYIHSLSLPIPQKDTYLNVTLDAGLLAARGGPATAQPIKTQVAVPGLFSLGVQSAQSLVVSNERNDPDHVLSLELSAGVSEDEIKKNVRVFVLPVFHPDTPAGKRKAPYQWSDPLRIGAEILKQSQALALEQIPAERDFMSLHSFKYEADVGRYLYLKVNRGLKSFHGYVLGKTFDQIVQVPPLPKEVRILQAGALLALNGERKLSLYSRDVPALRFEVGRVLPNQVQHLVTQTRGLFNPIEFKQYEFNDDNLVERESVVRRIDPAPPGKAQYHGFDLSPYLEKNKARLGLFVVSIEGWDPEQNRAIGPPDRRLILLTDLGVVVKRALDGAQEVFVQSIETGQPVAGVNVEVLAKNGANIAIAKTDVQGRAQLASLKDFQRERQPALYLVRKERDASFLPIERYDRQLDLSRFDVGGIANAVDAQQLSAYLFSDRGIYRPGDTVHIGMIVKAGDWKTALAGVPLEAIITDARGLTIKRERLRLSESGFEELSFTTQEASPTGAYTATLYIVKDDNRDSLLGSVSVKVQEFLPDRMKISARFSSEVEQGWVRPDDLSATVNLQNLFGTPAQNRRVTGALTLSPALPAFSAYKDFIFRDPSKAKQEFRDTLAETKTNEQGEAQLRLNLERFAAATYRLHLLAQGYEAEGGRSVATERAILVSPLPYLIGYKADGDLRYMNVGAARSVELIAIDPSTKKIAADKLTLTHLQRKFVSVLTKQPNGTFKYESKPKEVKLKSEPFAVSAQGVNQALPTDEPGDFALLVSDAKGVELNRIDYSVAGEGNVARSLERNAELELKLSKTDYAPGEAIEVQIRAPYVGHGLITVEREKVHAFKWFSTGTNNSVETIDLPPGIEGNAYVSVVFVRDFNSDEIFMSPLAYGMAPFSVSLAARKNDITVQAAPRTKPGEPLKVSYSSAKPARIALFAVDEGILQVAGYTTPDPLGHFFQKRALEVSTAQILDLILPEFSQFMQLAAPGGDAAGALGKFLNPFKRRRDKPVAFWSGIVDAGPEAKEWIIEVPDYFNGTLKIMAVAVAGDSVGVADVSTLVRGDFVISPNVPTSIAPGDEIEITAGITNSVIGSGKQAKVQVTLQTSDHFELVTPAKLELTIDELAEATASFRVRAKQKLGSGTFTFTAGLGDKSAKLSTDASVRPAVPFSTKLQVGAFRKGTKEVPVTRRMYAEHRTLEAGISNLPLALAHGLVGYLRDFPYSCTEQLVSQGMPAIVLAKRPEFGFTRNYSDDKLNELIAILRSRQNDEGAFGLWAANPHIDEWVTVYALHFLLEARERGFAVPRDVLDNGANWLTQFAATEGSALGEERARAYAIYVLTRLGVVTSNYADALQTRLEKNHAKVWQQDIAAALLAASYALMREDRLADRLARALIIGQAPQQIYFDYYDPLIHDALTIYLIAKHFPHRLEKLPPQALLALVKPIETGAYNSLSSAYTILAMDAFAAATSTEQAGKFSIHEILRDATARALPLPAGVVPKVTFSPAAQKLRFTSESEFNAFYSVNESGFDISLPTVDIKQGLEVLREYVDASGKTVSEIGLGDEIEVHVKVRAIGRETLHDAAIVDLLPGGFEIVAERAAPSVAANETAPAEGEGGEEETSSGNAARADYVAPVASTKSTWHPDYVDVREDRVVIYGLVAASVQEFVYRIKATNVGSYQVPPTFGESMYDRAIQARSLGGKISVKQP